MTDLQQLISRIEGGEGADREIDYEIARFEGWTYQQMKGDRQPYWRGPNQTEYYMRERNGPPSFTASLDAALSLVERVLPDAYPDIYRNVTSPSHPQIKAWSVQLTDQHCEAIGAATDDVTASTPALALCLALLKALQSQGDHP